METLGISVAADVTARAEALFRLQMLGIALAHAGHNLERDERVSSFSGTFM